MHAMDTTYSVDTFNTCKQLLLKTQRLMQKKKMSLNLKIVAKIKSFNITTIK